MRVSDISMAAHKTKGDIMLLPGFTADASLPAEALSRAVYGGGIVDEPSNRSIEPALPGSTEQAYIDCVADCRTAARLHQISDLDKCIRGCAAGPGTSGRPGTSQSAPAPAPAPCTGGGIPVTCPDGFVGCCPGPKVTLPFFGTYYPVCRINTAYGSGRRCVVAFP